MLMSLSVTTLLYGQETDFADLKSKMTSKSLPLVNLTYDETKLNTATFIEGKIEIVDLQKRTEGKINVSYHAKFRIRGASAGGLNKKSFSVKLLDENSKDLDADLIIAACFLASASPLSLRINSAIPVITFMGVLISWDIFARKLLLAWSAAFACSMLVMISVISSWIRLRPMILDSTTMGEMVVSIANRLPL